MIGTHEMPVFAPSVLPETIRCPAGHVVADGIYPQLADEIFPVST
jgi:hypothetical protein